MLAQSFLSKLPNFSKSSRVVLVFALLSGFNLSFANSTKTTLPKKQVQTTQVVTAALIHSADKQPVVVQPKQKSIVPALVPFKRTPTWPI